MQEGAACEVHFGWSDDAFAYLYREILGYTDSKAADAVQINRI